MPLRESMNNDPLNQRMSIPPEVERMLTVGLEAIVGRSCGGVSVNVYFVVQWFRVLPSTTIQSRLA